MYCITSYNDNGFERVINNPKAVLRTDFFIGLGLLVYRKLFEKKWLPKYPKTHWDHFLSADSIRKTCQCIYPEISRTFNIGSSGTHTGYELYHRLFENIKLQDQKIEWSLDDTYLLHSDQYSKVIDQRIADATQVESLSEINSLEGPSVVFYESSVDKKTLVDQVWRNNISPFFHLWGAHIRTSTIFGTCKRRSGSLLLYSL